MRLKIFHGANMAEAMAQIRTELGPDAIILEQRRTRLGVEVTAALEPEEPLLIQPAFRPTSLALSGPLDFHNLPPTMVQSLAAELGRSPTGADMGKLMGAAKAQLAGKADMGQVSAAVKAALAG